MHSNRGYSLLWDLPSFGYIDLGNTTSHFHADATPYLSLWVTTTANTHPPDPWGERLAKYTHATGRAPLFPKWASGYWQSRNRYRNQTEVLEVAAGFKALSLPLDLLIIDYHSVSQSVNFSAMYFGFSLTAHVLSRRGRFR